MQDLLALKTALEKPGVGKYRHNLAKCFRGRTDVPLEWIEKWLSTEWHVIGHKYLWLAAMEACIGRDVPIEIIERGLRKTDPSTFNAAIEACRGRNISFSTISQWYESGSVILQLAAVTACLDKPNIPGWFIGQAITNNDIRVRKIAEQIPD